MSDKSKRRKARRIIREKRFPTLAGMLASFRDGELTHDEFTEIIGAIEMGKGLQKRDRELAGFIEDAPERLEKDPVYVKGYNDGLMAALAIANDEEAVPVPVTSETDIAGGNA